MKRIYDHIDHGITWHFEQQAKAHPDAIAIESQSGAMSYGELNSYANQIAQVLREQDCGEMVATYFDINPGSIAAILGILKSGRAYVPLNPRYHRQITSKILKTTEINIVLTESKYYNFQSDGMCIIDISEIKKEYTPNCALHISPDTPCCIVFTSGSTGEPKGVIHSHRNVLGITANYIEQLSIEPSDKVLQLSHGSFVAAMANTFASLLSGATICTFDVANRGLQALLEEIRTRRVTVYHSVPTIFLQLSNLLPSHQYFDRIRLVLLGGEPVHRRHVELFKEKFPTGSQFVIVYGATEAVGATFYTIADTNKIPFDRLPVGHAPAGYQIEIVDDHRNLLPPLKTGEIRIRGKLVSSGYYEQPTLTWGVFEVAGNHRIYYTRDLGYLDENGCLHYLGRSDSVLKISGQKVSLLQIEAQLLRHKYIREAVVLPHPEMSQSHLAFFVSAHNLNIPELRQWLSAHVSDHMIPSHFIQLTSLPLTSNGKIDRQYLLANHLPNRPVFTKPGNALEKKLTRIWQDVFQLNFIGVHDNFFDLGGSSLLGIELIKRVETMVGRALPNLTLYNYATIRQMASFLGRQDNPAPSRNFSLNQGTYHKMRRVIAGCGHAPAGPGSLIVQVHPHGKKDPLIWCFNAPAFELYRLSLQLGNEQPIYGLFSGSEIVPRDQQISEQIAAHYVEEILGLLPEGPYYLGGNCRGGHIASQIARQMIERGKQIDKLCLLEFFHPFLYDYTDPLLLLYGRQSALRAYDQFGWPNPGWETGFKSAPQVAWIPGRHGQFFRMKNLSVLGSNIDSFLHLGTEHHNKNKSFALTDFTTKYPEQIKDWVTLTAAEVLNKFRNI